MSSFIRQRVRLAIDVGLKQDIGAIRDVISGAQPKFARAAGLQIEIALFFNGDLLDITNVSTATLEIKQRNDPDASVAMTKTIGSTAMNRTLTEAQWDTGDADKAHFIFEWLSTETGDSVFSSPGDEEEHWIVLWGYTSDAAVDVDVFAVGKIKSFDAGIDGTVSAPPASEGGVTLSQLQAYLQDFLKKVNGPGITATFESPNTGKKVKIGVDDNGDWYEEANPGT